MSEERELTEAGASDFGQTIRWVEEASEWEKENTVFVGPVVEGDFVNMITNCGANNSNMYTIKQDEGNISFFGSTVLDDKLKEIPEGSFVRVEFLGLKQAKNGGNHFRNFSVNLRDSLCDVLQYVSSQSLNFLDLA